MFPFSISFITKTFSTTVIVCSGCWQLENQIKSRLIFKCIYEIRFLIYIIKTTSNCASAATKTFWVWRKNEQTFPSITLLLHLCMSYTCCVNTCVLLLKQLFFSVGPCPHGVWKCARIHFNISRWQNRIPIQLYSIRRAPSGAIEISSKSFPF